MEARSNAPGLLDSLRLPVGEPREEDAMHPGIFSVVIDTVELGFDSLKKTRKLPALYFGNAIIFTDRSVGAVCEWLVRLVEVVLKAAERSTYCLHPISFDGRLGLYGRDLHNRSSYRRRLERLGVTFSSDPYPRLTDRGTFECDDWGEFQPEVAVFTDDDEEPAAVVETTGALLPFSFASLRLGVIGIGELQLLTRVTRSVRAASAGDAAALMNHLRNGRTS